MKIQAPIELEIKVSITDGEVDGVATIGLGKGSYPSEDKIREAVAKFERESLPDGFRLMNKREWWDTVCPTMQQEDEDGEIYTSRFAMPGGDEYAA